MVNSFKVDGSEFKMLLGFMRHYTILGNYDFCINAKGDRVVLEVASGS